MVFAHSGIDKGAFCGMIALMFALLVGFSFLAYYQKEAILNSGLENKHDAYLTKDDDWMSKSIHCWPVLSALGGMMVGQFRRVYHIENNPALPALRSADCISAVISVFAGSVFLCWGLAALLVADYNEYNGTFNISAWSFVPYAFFFSLLSAGTHKYLGVKQDVRQMVGIALITVAFIVFFAGMGSSGGRFSFLGFFFFFLSCSAYSHYWIKIEFILKRRACNVFEVVEKFGLVLFIFNMICVIITGIYQAASGNEWTFGIYVKAVFTNSAWNFFLTILVPPVIGLMHVICLVLIYNSSSIRFLTILMLPMSFLLLFCIESVNGVAITGIVLLFIGLVVYNATTVCGRQALTEQKLTMAYDAYEDEHFKRVENTQVNAEYSANNMA